MDLRKIDSKLLDAAIQWQIEAPQPDRERFADQIAGSRECEEYIGTAIIALFNGQPFPIVLRSALSIGIEIGLAIADLQRKPQA